MHIEAEPDQQSHGADHADNRYCHRGNNQAEFAEEEEQEEEDRQTCHRGRGRHLNQHFDAKGVFRHRQTGDVDAVFFRPVGSQGADQVGQTPPVPLRYSLPILIAQYNDPANVDVLRKFGFEVYYGDITRLDLLESAGAAEAELLLITISDIERSQELVELVQKHYPHLKIAANAFDHSSAYDLMDLGVTQLRRETFGSALELGQVALQLMGKDPYETHRLMRIFRKNDEDTMPELYKTHREDEAKYISVYQQKNADLEELMELDKHLDLEELDKAWTAQNPEK